MQLGEAERVVRPVGADLQRVQRQPQVVDRRCRAGEVVDEVDRLVDEERLDDVRVQEARTPARGCAAMLASDPVSKLSTQITR